MPPPPLDPAAPPAAAPPTAPDAVLLAALAQLGEGVIVADAAGRITFVNEAAARMRGVARAGPRWPANGAPWSSSRRSAAAWRTNASGPSTS